MRVALVKVSLHSNTTVTKDKRGEEGKRKARPGDERTSLSCPRYGFSVA